MARPKKAAAAPAAKPTRGRGAPQKPQPAPRGTSNTSSREAAQLSRRAGERDAKPAKRPGTPARQGKLAGVSGDGDDKELNALILTAYEATEDWQRAQKAMTEARQKVQDALKAKKLKVYVSDDHLEAKRNVKEATEKLTITKSKDGQGTIPAGPVDSGSDDEEWI